MEQQGVLSPSPNAIRAPSNDKVQMVTVICIYEMQNIKHGTSAMSKAKMKVDVPRYSRKQGYRCCEQLTAPASYPLCR